MIVGDTRPRDRIEIALGRGLARPLEQRQRLARITLTIGSLPGPVHPLVARHFVTPIRATALPLLVRPHRGVG